MAAAIGATEAGAASETAAAAFTAGPKVALRGRSRCAMMVSTPTTNVMAAKKYQASLHPSAPPLAMMRGTIGPAMTRASEEPEVTTPDAIPRRRTSNQADMRATEGTRTRPPPNPVSNRAAEAETSPLDRPVTNIPTAAAISPMLTTLRGPNREASTPPMAAMITYPARFQEASEPAAALLIPRSFCIEGRMAL